MSETTRITVKLTPKAAKNEIQDWETDLFGDQTLKATVTAAPERGKANKALIELLAQYFGMPKSDFSIVRGETSRVKIIEIKGIVDKIPA